MARNPWAPFVQHLSDDELDHALEVYLDDADLHVQALRIEKEARLTREDPPTPSRTAAISEPTPEVPDSELPWSTTERIVLNQHFPKIRQSSAMVHLATEPLADDEDTDTDND